MDEEVQQLIDAVHHLINHIQEQLPDFHCEDLDNIEYLIKKLRANA